MNELTPLQLPDFTYPWPDTCSPYAERVEQGFIDWAEAHQLFVNDEVRTRAVRSKFGWMAARCYPTAPPEALQIIAYFIGWLFLTDDFYFDRVDTLTPQTIANITAVINVLDLDTLGPTPVFGERALLDISRRLRPQLGAERFQGFAQGVRMTHGGAALQILAHLQNTPVTLPEYECIRRHGGAMPPCLELIEFANGYRVDIEQRNCPEVEQLKLHTNNIACWTNDIYSLGIELKQPGQYENLISIYASQGHSLQDGVNFATAKVRAELASFLRIAEALSAHASEPLQHYIHGLKYWISGHQRWGTTDTTRYLAEFFDSDSDQRSIAQILNTTV